MAKDKEYEALYKAEGLRKLKERKQKRNDNYRHLSSIANEFNCPMSGAKNGGCWADSNSPTGYSQICSYQGTCQSPCNGDC
jgi:hypothetical protein